MKGRRFIMLKMFEKIEVTLENYEEILAKIRKLTAHNYLIQLRRLWEEEGKEPRNVYPPIYLKRHIKEFKLFGEWRYFAYSTPALETRFIDATEHPRVIDYKNNGKEFESGFDCVIHMYYGPGTGGIISIGDYVRFFPFGFEVIQYAFSHSPRDIERTFHENKIILCTESYIINPFKRFKDKDAILEEMDKRDREIDEQLMKEDMEYENNRYRDGDEDEDEEAMPEYFDYDDYDKEDMPEYFDYSNGEAR